MPGPSAPFAPTRRRYRVLFLCETNAAWSLMAEAMLNQSGRGVFQALSAGLHPAPIVDPMTLEHLRASKLPVDHCFTKSVQDFRAPGALPLDFVFASFDLHAAGLDEGWPGHPALAHWNIPDPSALQGSEAKRQVAFRQTMSALQNRIHLILALPLDKVEQLAGIVGSRLSTVQLA